MLYIFFKLLFLSGFDGECVNVYNPAAFLPADWKCSASGVSNWAGFSGRLQKYSATLSCMFPNAAYVPVENQIN